MHSDATTAADTDWVQIVQLYDHLLLIAPTPVVALNRAVAVAEVDGKMRIIDMQSQIPRTTVLSSTDSAEKLYRSGIAVSYSA